MCSGTGCISRTAPTWAKRTYAQQIKAGEEIIAGSNERFRVLDVVPFEDETDTFVGMLKDEVA